MTITREHTPQSTRLMYSVNDNLLTADQLDSIPTPKPLGRFHQPVGFGEFADLVRHRLAHNGIQIDAEEYAVPKDNQSFFGCMELSFPQFNSDDIRLTLGIRGSHNQKLPRAICLGNQVIVCSNLCFSGDLAKMSTKQTLNIWERLPALVDQAVQRIPQMATRELERIDAYKLFPLKPRHGDAALVELYRQGALTAPMLGRAVDQWHNPAYEAHTESGDSAWKLLQAVTEVQKPTGNSVNMETVRARTTAATQWLDSVVGL